MPRTVTNLSKSDKDYEDQFELALSANEPFVVMEDNFYLNGYVSITFYGPDIVCQELNKQHFVQNNHYITEKHDSLDSWSCTVHRDKVDSIKSEFAELLDAYEHDPTLGLKPKSFKDMAEELSQKLRVKRDLVFDSFSTEIYEYTQKLIQQIRDAYEDVLPENVPLYIDGKTPYDGVILAKVPQTVTLPNGNSLITTTEVTITEWDFNDQGYVNIREDALLTIKDSLEQGLYEQIRSESIKMLTKNTLAEYNELFAEMSKSPTEDVYHELVECEKELNRLYKADPTSHLYKAGIEVDDSYDTHYVDITEIAGEALGVDANLLSTIRTKDGIVISFECRDELIPLINIENYLDIEEISAYVIREANYEVLNDLKGLTALESFKQTYGLQGFETISIVGGSIAEKAIISDPNIEPVQYGYFELCKIDYDNPYDVESGLNVENMSMFHKDSYESTLDTDDIEADDIGN